MGRTDRRADVFGVVALAAAGMLVGHQLGYLADSDARAGHVHLGLIGPVVIVAAIAAAWFAAVRVVRADPGRPPRWWTLSAVQVALYAVLEVGERVILDADVGSLASLPVALGLLAQPIVAWVALEFVGAAGDLISRFVDGAEPPRHDPPGPSRRPALLLLPVRSSRAHRRRSPPLR